MVLPALVANLVQKPTVYLAGHFVKNGLDLKLDKLSEYDCLTKF